MKKLWNFLRQYPAQSVLVVLSLTTLSLAGLRVGSVFFNPDPKVQAARHQVIDERTLMYLGAAGALLLLRDVKKLAFGDFQLEFERRLNEVKAAAEEVKTVAENAQAMATGTGGEKAQGRSEGAALAAPAGAEIQPGSVPDDPWKGVFGGRSTSRHRELTAEFLSGVSATHSRIRLRVQSTTPDTDPLRGSVQFYLHDTFLNDRPVVSVSPAGVAELSIDAWGAFTVGAVADGGLTRLELDLAEHPDFPAEFRAR